MIREFFNKFFRMMRNDSSLCPPDIAKFEFYQFIKSTEGRHLYDMFNVIDQPSEALWEHYHNWWTSSKIEWDNQFNPRGNLDATWCRFVMWTSKMFMDIYSKVLATMSINPTIYNGEELLWEATMMKNLILELKLATKMDSVAPKTWFQRVVALRKCITQSFNNIKVSLGTYLLSLHCYKLNF